MRFTLCAAIVATGFSIATAGFSAQSGAAKTGYAGSEKCQACHQDQHRLFQRDIHFKAAEQRGWAERAAGCESCHGPGLQHAEDPTSKSGLVTFAHGESGRSNTACLSCHRDDTKVAGFLRSSHGRNGVACTDCHASAHVAASAQPRGAALRSFEDRPVRSGRHLKSETSELCLSCHADIRGQFRMPHRHPLGAQGLSCASCHNPHQPEPVESRRTNAQCQSCHQDKRGPWAYEHPPAAEDCLSCHASHGSVSAGLTKSAQPFLCLSCHSLSEDRHGAEVGGTRFSRAFLSRCTACHGAVHGSHEDRHLKR